MRQSIYSSLARATDSSHRIAAPQHVRYINKQIIRPDSILQAQAEHRSTPTTSWRWSHA